ncbi:MAG: SH3 domain-containing protein [Lachnospiraceae bacterium]|nr:SH3 domain-containing protein [Lachnospiraceae bacterium]
MNKRFTLGLITLVLSISLLVGCGSLDASDAVNSVETIESSETPEVSDVAESVENQEPPHEHAYTETVTTEATCTTDGEKTFTCECGDSYTEVITAIGHIFENYTSNGDATYLADGTETATCICGETDTRTAEGSMLEYTYTDMDATMYVQKSVNVRSMPGTDGEKMGGLSTNDEVKVTGQCVETGWYRIEFDGNVAYVSNNYLGADKVVVQESVPEQSGSSGYKIVLKSGYSYVDTTVASYAEACQVANALGYPVWQITDEGEYNVWYYCMVSHVWGNTDKGTFDADFSNAEKQFVSIMEARGYNPYPIGNNNRLGTKDGRIYIPDASGGTWSISIFDSGSY